MQTVPHGGAWIWYFASQMRESEVVHYHKEDHLEAEFLDENNNKHANAAIRASSAKPQKNTTTDEDGNTVDEDGNIVKMKNPRGRPRKQKDPRENDIPLLCLYTMTPYMIPKTMKQQRQQLQGTGIVNNQRVPDQNCPGNQWWNLLLASLREVQTNLREHGQELITGKSVSVNGICDAVTHHKTRPNLSCIACMLGKICHAYLQSMKTVNVNTFSCDRTVHHATAGSSRVYLSVRRVQRMTVQNPRSPSFV